MDGSRFDSLTRLVSQASSRRNTLRSALGAAAASTVAVVGLTALSSEADAQRRNRNNNNKPESQTAQAVPALPAAGGWGSLFDQRAMLHGQDRPNLRTGPGHRGYHRLLRWDRRPLL